MLSKSTILGIMLVSIFVSLTFSLQQVKAITIVVPDDYSTIQGAVNAASDGDTISVRNGTYHEKVTVDKPLTLAGENKDNTAIEQLNVSCIGDVHLTNIGINQLDIKNSTSIWATGCRFQEANIRSRAKLLLSRSEAWEVHTYDKGEILGFYDLPLFGIVTFAFPFGFVFYILILLLAIAVTVGLVLVYILRRKSQRTSSQGLSFH